MGIVSTYLRAFNTKRLDPYPVEILKRVDRPTTVVRESEIPRVDERESGFNRALRGDFGPQLTKERHRFVSKHPLSGALVNMQFTLAQIVDGIVAKEKAPLPEDPAAMARHIKETAYFLRADIVAISELPHYAVYSHSMATGEPVELQPQIRDLDRRGSGLEDRRGHGRQRLDQQFHELSRLFHIRASSPASWRTTSGGSATLPGPTMRGTTRCSFPPFCSRPGSGRCAGSAISC